MDWIAEFIEMMFPVNGLGMVEKAFLLKQRNIPKALFKYRRADEYSIKNFEADTVWLSSPLDFNDPYDCSFTVDFDGLSKSLVKQNLDAYLSATGIGEFVGDDIVCKIKNSDDPVDFTVEHLLQREPGENRERLREILHKISNERNSEILNVFVDFMKSSSKVCSFSEKNDSILMWSHYSDNHKGFCIEYDVANLPYGNLCSRFMYPVVYTSELLDVTSAIMGGQREKINVFRLILPTLIKSNEWEYEKEWRLVVSGGVIKEACCFAMPTPVALYLGSKIKAQDQQTLMDIAINKKIPVYKMSLSNKEFRLIPSDNI